MKLFFVLATFILSMSFISTAQADQARALKKVLKSKELAALEKSARLDRGALVKTEITSDRDGFITTYYVILTYNSIAACSIQGTIVERAIPHNLPKSLPSQMLSIYSKPNLRIQGCGTH